MLDFDPFAAQFCFMANASVLPDEPISKTRPVNSRAAVQAVYLQNLIIKTTEDKLKPGELSGLARAWCDLQEERRKLAMRPLPRPVDTTKLPKRGSRRNAQVMSEPVEPTKAA
jgi:hypothetical protein